MLVRGPGGKCWGALTLTLPMSSYLGSPVTCLLTLCQHFSWHKHRDNAYSMDPVWIRSQFRNQQYSRVSSLQCTLHCIALNLHCDYSFIHLDPLSWMQLHHGCHEWGEASPMQISIVLGMQITAQAEDQSVRRCQHGVTDGHCVPWGITHVAGLHYKQSSFYYQWVQTWHI